MTDYPNLWRRGLIQKQVRERANHRCEECDMEFVLGTNLAVAARNRKDKPIIGTVHHINGDKANCSMKNLVFLCQRCHMRLHSFHWWPGMALPYNYRNTAPKWMRERDIPYTYNKRIGNVPELYERTLL